MQDGQVGGVGVGINHILESQYGQRVRETLLTSNISSKLLRAIATTGWTLERPLSTHPSPKQHRRGPEILR
jgi:hypothetical protein